MASCSGIVRRRSTTKPATASAYLVAGHFNINVPG
jgi:hypothetical protein